MKEIFKNIFTKNETKNNKPINNTEVQIQVPSPIKLEDGTKITQKNIDEDIKKFHQEAERIAKELSNPYRVKHVIWAGIKACVIYANGEHKYISREEALELIKD